MTGFHVRANECCPRSGEGQEGMRVVLLMGWRGERFDEPGHQIAVGQESHAQEVHQIGQAPAETGGQLQVAQQQREPKIRVSRRFKKPLVGSVYIQSFKLVLGPVNCGRRTSTAPNVII